MVIEKRRAEEDIKERKVKIAEISRTMPFLTTKLLFLGKDRNSSEYFFYLHEPNRVYLLNKAYVLDPNQHFYLYEGR